jgi:prefoldin subunit 5
MWYAAFEAPEPVNQTLEQKLEKLQTREVWLQKELDEVRREITQTQNPTIEK